MTTDGVRIEQDYYAIRVKSGNRIVACAARNSWNQWHIARRTGPQRLVAWDVVDTKAEAYGLLARLVTGGVA